MVVLTARALWLFDFHTRMRVHPSSQLRPPVTVWSDWNVLSCECLILRVSCLASVLSCLVLSCRVLPVLRLNSAASCDEHPLNPAVAACSLKLALLVSHAFAAHVPLKFDGLVRPPARSISLVPANDVPARIALAGKLLVMRPSRPHLA